jgi:hypothetical protein
MLVVEARHTTEAKHGGPLRRLEGALRPSAQVTTSHPKLYGEGLIEEEHSHEAQIPCRSPNRDPRGLARRPIQLLRQRLLRRLSPRLYRHRQSHQSPHQWPRRPGAHHGAACLATLTLHGAFIINRDSFTTRCPDILNVSGEVGSAHRAEGFGRNRATSRPGP